MKKIIHMEGFKDYPKAYMNTNMGKLIETLVPYYKDKPCWNYTYFGNSNKNTVGVDFTYEGVTYQGLLDNNNTTNIKFNLPKTAITEKKRYYCGVRMVCSKFNMSYAFASTNASTNANCKFKDTIGSSRYVEAVVDLPTQTLLIYVNKILFAQLPFDTSFKNTINGSGSFVYLGTQGSGARVGDNVLYTDIYFAEETWDTEEVPPIEVYGPVSVDTYRPKEFTGDGFAANTGTLVENLSIPMGNSATDVGIIVDKCVYTSNEGNTGTIKFNPVPVSDKIIGGCVTVLASKGGSTNASLITKVKEGDTTVVSDEYIPPLFSETSMRMSSYPLGDNIKTADALNQIQVDLHTKA